MFKAILLLITLHCSFLAWAGPEPAAPDSEDDFLFGAVLSSPRVVYHWTSTNRARKFLSKKGMIPNAVMYKLMYLNRPAVYGPGLHVDEDPTVWFDRGPGASGGSLLEITVPAKSRMVEYEDEQLLRSLGVAVSPRHVNLVRDDKMIVIRNSDGLYVSRFTGKYLPANSLIRLHYLMQTEADYLTRNRVNSVIRKEFRDRVAEDPRLLDIPAVQRILQPLSLVDSCVSLLFR